MCNFSRLSYEDNLHENFVDGVEDLVELSDEDTDAQAYIGVMDLSQTENSDGQNSGKAIVVCFRGTESVQDVIADFTTIRIPFATQGYTPKTKSEGDIVLASVMTDVVLNSEDDSNDSDESKDETSLDEVDLEDSESKEDESSPGRMTTLKNKVKSMMPTKNTGKNILASAENLKNKTSNVTLGDITSAPVKLVVKSGEMALAAKDKTHENLKAAREAAIVKTDQAFKDVKAVGETLKAVGTDLKENTVQTVKAGAAELKNKTERTLTSMNSTVNSIVGAYVPKPTFLSTFTSSRGPTVHWGFMCQYESLQQDIKKYIRDHPDITRIICTGHSLGGSLATICAPSLGISACGQYKDISCVTFGATKVGCKKFAALFNDVVGESIRVVNANDPFPIRPCSRKYKHVKGFMLVHNCEETPRSNVGMFNKIVNAMNNSMLMYFGYGIGSMGYHSAQAYYTAVESCFVEECEDSTEECDSMDSESKDAEDEEKSD
ncbi:MAG: lipase family protein [Colwellia sp.]|nr:lipase family protein [Colwellia sp.]